LRVSPAVGWKGPTAKRILSAPKELDVAKVMATKARAMRRVNEQKNIFPIPCLRAKPAVASGDPALSFGGTTHSTNRQTNLKGLINLYKILYAIMRYIKG
jgi:hypothetical protein